MKVRKESILNNLTYRYLSFCIAVIVLFAIIPLFFNLPFRDNIYLTWEGAYRMYSGQMPFKDFGLPLGYAFWLLPTVAFHFFGPYLFSLVKIQVLINVISGVAFLVIIKRFSRDLGLISASIVLYVISFSFYNFWPWYNHTVIVYEFVGLAFLIVVLTSEKLTKWKYVVYLVGSALFTFLSIFTKQDGGAFALFICGLLLIYHTVITKKWGAIVVYGISYILITSIFIIPLIQYEFGYWFNYGQAPHYSRISLMDFVSVILGGSTFIKMYFLAIAIIVLVKLKSGLIWFKSRIEVLHLILTLGILFQASILQVTSYVPADSNIYFHSFMFFYILTNIDFGFKFDKLKTFIPLILLVAFWWSGLYWKYANRMFSKFIEPSTDQQSGVVSMSTYTNAKDTVALDKSTWIFSKEKPFHGIKMPIETVQAVDRLKEWNASQASKPRVLNMSEITPLAEVLGYELETGMPLWYHLNVGMFDRELHKISDRIKDNYYDLVIFENIPHLNNFYPFAVREKLQKKYDLLFTFQAPREMTSEVIEVYVKRD